MRRGEVIFLVDDDLDDQELFVEALKTIDDSLVCLTAADGQEAIAKLKRLMFTPDMIFLDVNMPKMNGERCLDEIKKINTLQNIPVVICSTSVHPTEINRYKSKGAAEVLVKSPAFKNFVSVLRATLETYLR